jgi:hypothetical protein
MVPDPRKLAERSVPRYTSYPTAPHFTAAVGPADHAAWLAALPPVATLSVYPHVPFCAELCCYSVDAADALIGLGASVIGRLPQGHVQNAPDIGGYSRAIAGGRFATVRGIAMSPDDRLRGRIIERLMCDFAVDLDAAAADGSGAAGPQTLPPSSPPCDRSLTTASWPSTAAASPSHQRDGPSSASPPRSSMRISRVSRHGIRGRSRSPCFRISLSENRYPLFREMLEQKKSAVPESTAQERGHPLGRSERSPRKTQESPKGPSRTLPAAHVPAGPAWPSPLSSPAPGWRVAPNHGH